MSNLLPNSWDRWGTRCFYAASLLTKPACWASKGAHCVLSPLTQGLLGKFDFAATKAQEIFKRTLYCLAIPLVAPFAAMTGFLGILIRFLGTKLRPRDFSCWQGDALPKILPAGDRPNVRVMSFNLCGIAGDMPRSHGGMVEEGRNNGEWAKRWDLIVKQVNEQNPDVLCFSEVQDVELLYFLYNKLKKDYHQFFVHQGAGAGKADSGLFIATKYRAEDFSFTRYKTVDKSTSAKWINKGFSAFHIKSSDRRIARIVATHMQYSSHSDEVRAQQAVQLMQKLVQLHKEDKEKNKPFIPTLLCGDFNMEREEIEKSLLGSEHFRIGYQEKEETCTNFYHQKIWDPSAPLRKERIDYANLWEWVPGNYTTSGQRELVSSEVRNTALKVWLSKSYNTENPDELPRSDHHAVVGDLSISRI